MLKPQDLESTPFALPKNLYEMKKIIIPIRPLNAAHNITELFILCGKNQVNLLFAASSKRIFATSTIGINDTHAINALKKKILQKTIFPF